MSSYLSPAQLEQLLRPINPSRVGTDGKGYSHVEAYEIRAHLIRIFGPARWSEDVIDQQLVFETSEERTNKKGEPYMAWTVCYRTIVRLTVCAIDGTALATYTEGATGEATNQPGRGDAHELALKTSESQALKRCAFNLGDQFGLSLFNKGSKATLVKATLIAPKTDEKAKPAAEPVDAHITEPLPAESVQVEDKREKSEPPPPPPPASGDRDKKVAAWRAALLKGPKKGEAVAPWYARKHMEASTGGFLTALVEDRDGNVINVGALLNAEQKRARSAAA